MGRGLGAGLLALGLLTACSSGGGSAAKTTTTVSTSTSTTVATTSTTKPEDAMKQAYLDYWKMIDRLNAAPNPDDPELAQRATEPLISTIKDQLSAQKSTGHSFRSSPDRPLSHTVSDLVVSGATGTIRDCYVDGTIEFDANDQIIDSGISTRTTEGALVLIGSTWKVASLKFVKSVDGVKTCD
jgi:hypothetical protein